MGLSGAEDPLTNQRIIEYLKLRHGDLASHLYLTSDSVAAVATAFDKGTLKMIFETFF